MEKVHFELRACNSNNENLRNLMINDGRFITHEQEFDKVLGYKYSSTKDIMKLANVKINAEANTHRKLLS